MTYLERLVRCQSVLWVVEPVWVAIGLDVHHTFPT